MLLPFDLPEIRAHLAPFLDTKSMVACAAVSHAWNDSFVPYLWRTTSVFNHKTINPPTEGIIRHGHLIRELQFMGFVSMDHFIPAPNCTLLHTLTLHSNNMKKTLKTYESPTKSNLPKDISRYVTAIIKQNPGLMHIQLVDQPSLSTVELWNAIAECPKLSSLQLDQVTVPEDHVDAMWKACTNVQTLSLDKSTIFESSNMSSFTFPRIQSLKMSHISQTSMLHQLHVVDKSPMLQTLHWKQEYAVPFPAEPFRKAVIRNRYSSLNHLSIASAFADAYDLPDEELGIILDTMTGLTFLSTQFAGFAKFALEALVRHHASTLTTLNLATCPYLTSKMVQKIMSSFPALKQFAGPMVIGQDIVEGDPWVCTNLKDLTLHFNLSGHRIREDVLAIKSKAQMDEELQQEQENAFQQLARLEKLEQLTILRDAEKYPDSATSLDLRLSGGLKSLETLRQLAHVNLHGTHQVLGMEEIDWMFEHWPRISFLMGTLHPNPRKHRELSAAFLAKKKARNEKAK